MELRHPGQARRSEQAAEQISPDKIDFGSPQCIELFA
jgi:hypothetical protein